MSGKQTISLPLADFLVIAHSQAAMFQLGNVFSTTEVADCYSRTLVGNALTGCCGVRLYSLALLLV
jgi:hypothetical protein